MIVLKKLPDPIRGSPEKRRFGRRTTHRAGSLWSSDNTLITRASMVDMSSGGACLELAAPVALPPRFTVRFERQSGAKAHVVHCQLVWQHERMIGVRFCEGASKATS